MTDVRPLDVSRFEDVDRFIPIPDAWTMLGKRDVVSKKNGQTTTYTLIEYKLQDGLVVGLFVTDMGEDADKRSLVRKSAMERAVFRATEQAKNGRA